jgi:hypothetical protein
MLNEEMCVSLSHICRMFMKSATPIKHIHFINGKYKMFYISIIIFKPFHG